MKKIIVAFFCLFAIYSCNNEEKHPDDIVHYPDRTNYKHIPLKNNVVKVIRFFPNTKDTDFVYFFDSKRKIRVNTEYRFHKDGHKISNIEYKDSMQIRICTDYHKNGNVKAEYILFDDRYKGDRKDYYETGELKIIRDFVFSNNKELLNNTREYKKNGELIRDKTFYAELISDKDTVSINDSIKINFKLILPKNSEYSAHYGTVEMMSKDVNSETLDFFEKYFFYFKPKHLGENFARIIFNIFPSPEPNSPFIKLFEEKRIYVTE